MLCVERMYERMGACLTPAFIQPLSTAYSFSQPLEQYSLGATARAARLVPSLDAAVTTCTVPEIEASRVTARGGRRPAEAILATDKTRGARVPSASSPPQNRRIVNPDAAPAGIIIDAEITRGAPPRSATNPLPLGLRHTDKHCKCQKQDVGRHAFSFLLWSDS